MVRVQVSICNTAPVPLSFPRNHWKCVEAREDVQRSRNRVAEVGFEYFCLDYVSKNGVSVMERNIGPGNTVTMKGMV